MNDLLSTPGTSPVAPSDSTSDEHRAALDRSLVHGMVWTAAGRWLVQVCTWVSTIFIARILSPDDYGVVGMATVYIGLTSLITDFGLSSAVVALRNLSKAQIAQLNTVAVLLGLLTTLASLALATPLSWFFRLPQVSLVVVALSGTLLVDSLRSVPAAVLAKDMRFKFLAVVEAGKGLIVAVVTVTLAYAGFGYWALVAGIILTSILSTLFVLLRSRVPFGRPHLSELSEAIHYTKHFLVGNLAWYAYSNADFVVAGRVLGRTALGEYTYAWTLANAPIEKIAGVTNRVLPPLYAAVSADKAALSRYVRKLSEAMALLILPAAVGLSFVAGDFVRLVLGAKWIGSIVPLRILAFYGLLQGMSLLLSPILLVTGRVKLAATLGVLFAIVLPVAFAIGGSVSGTIGIAAVWVTVYPLILSSLFKAALQAIDLNFRAYFDGLKPAVVSCACMAAALTVLEFATAGGPNAGRLIAKICVGITVYFGVLYGGWRQNLTTLVDTLKSLR